MRKKLTEKKEKDIVTSSDSQTVKATDMTNLKELVNELHKNKITPPRDNFKYWSTNLPTVKGDPIRGKVTGKTEEEVYQKLAKFYGIHIIDENATIEDMFYAWQNVKLEDGAITQQGFERCEADFKKFYVRTGWNNRKVKKMTPQEWKYYIENSVRGKTGGNRLTEKQKNRLLGCTTPIINQAFADGLITYTYSTVHDILTLTNKSCAKSPKKDDVYLPDEMDKIINYCEKQLDPKASCIRLIRITGMRVGEAVSIMRDDIDFDAMKVHVHKTEIKTNNGTSVADRTKTEAGDRTIKVKDCYKPFLGELCIASPSGSYVFINKKKNKQGKNGRIGTQAIRRYLKEVCNAVGVPYKGVHAIRKYYESQMKKNGVPDEIRKRQLGHKDISTTEKYYDRNLYSEQETAKYLNDCVGI